MPKKVTDERRRAGEKLRALIARDGRSQKEIGEAMGTSTGGADPVQSLRKWLSGNAFGDRQRRIAANFFGVAPDYFGLEGTSREDEAEDDPASALRWQSTRRWLESHPDAGLEEREAVAKADAVLYSDMGDDVTGAVIEAIYQSRRLQRTATALRGASAKASRQMRR